MKERFTPAALTGALAAVKPAVGSRYPLVVMEPGPGGVRFTADDMELSASVVAAGWSPMDGGDHGEPIAVPFAPLAALVSKLSEDVEMVSDDEHLRLRSGKVDASLPIAGTDWLPRRAEPEGDEITVTAVEWERVQALTAFASPDANRGPMHGVGFGEVGAVATDTYQLGLWRHPFATESVVPSRAISAAAAAELEGDEGPTIVTGSKAVRISVPSTVGPFTVNMATIAGDFPFTSIGKLINKPTIGRITVPVPVVRAAIERVAITSRPFTKGKQMLLRPVDSGGFELASLPEAPGDAQITEVVAADVDGLEWSLGINSAYFLACCDLAAGRKGDATIGLIGENEPLVWETEDSFGLCAPLVLRAGEK